MEELVVDPQIKNSIKEYLSKFNLNLCLTCGTCTSGCPISGTPGMEGWDTRKTLRMLAFGMVDEVVQSKFPWIRTTPKSSSCPIPRRFSPTMKT